MDLWPALPYADWKDTLETLHMAMQIVGGVRLSLSPPEPQWGHTALYCTARGLTTGPIPFAGGAFDIDVDLLDHRVAVRTQDGRIMPVALEARPISAFYRDMDAALGGLGIEGALRRAPSEVANPIPFADDDAHTSYDRAAIERFWQALSSVDVVFRRHRAPFNGRSTPVHFFWGSFDLALTRFSGEPCEPPPNVDQIMRLSCTAVEVSAGWWPGSPKFPEPAFYAYAYPKPEGLETAQVSPQGAFWEPSLGEFVLPYEEVRTSASPAGEILRFLESTYDAAARLMGWDPRLTEPVPTE